MRELAVQSAAAFLAVFGFSIILDAPKKYLLYAGLAGGAGWLAYLLVLSADMSLIAAAFASSLAAAVLSHLFARGLKAPVTVFLVAGILPTVPGASIYRCVYYLIQGTTELSTYYLVQTFQIAGAMAMAIFIVDSLFRLVLTRSVWRASGDKGSSAPDCSSIHDQTDDLQQKHLPH